MSVSEAGRCAATLPLKITRLTGITPEDLSRFARALEPKGLMERAVAAILDFQAMLRSKGP